MQSYAYKKIYLDIFDNYFGQVGWRGYSVTWVKWNIVSEVYILNNV
jgi:hypothetical protein